MTTPANLINQINDIKQRVATLDAGRLYYEIWCFTTENSQEYQIYAKGDNKNGTKCSPKFNTELDTVLANPNVAHIRVSLKSNRKQFGDVEIVIQPAYQRNHPTLTPMKVDMPTTTPQPTFEQPQGTQAQPNIFNGLGFLKLLGLGEMLNGAENDEFNGLGAVLAVRDRMIENKFEARDKDRELQRIVGENAVLQHKNTELEKEIKTLNGTIEKAEDEIADLEEKLSEYEKLNPKREMIGGLASPILTEALLGVVRKTKYAGLLGIDAENVQTTPAAPQSNMPQVAIEPIDESPRGKAKTQIVEWLDKLNDVDFEALYELLTLFAQGKSIQDSLNFTQNPKIVVLSD